MKKFFTKNRSATEKVDHLRNSFGSAWPSLISTLALLYLDFDSDQVYGFNIFFTSLVVIASVLIDCEQKLSQKEILRLDLDTRYCTTLILRLIIYLSISCLISSHIMYFPLLSWQSLLCCGLFIGNAERMIYQNYFNPLYSRFMLIMYQVPVIIAGFCLESHNANILALVLFLQFLIHAKKIRSFYRIYKTNNDLRERIESEKKELHTLLDLLPVGVAKLSYDLTYLHANKYIRDMSQNTLDTIVGRKVGFSGKSQFNMDMIESFLKSEEKNLDLNLQFFDSKTGQMRRHQTHWQKISDQEIVTVAVDVEDNMKEREFSLGILNAVSDPIFVKDNQLNWIYGNDSFSKVIGKDLEAYIHKSERELASAEVASRILKEEEIILHSSKPAENEEVLLDAQSKPLTFLTKKTPFHLPTGERVLVGVMRDITDRRRLEIDLLEKSKFASLGQMAAGVAHEINNPLAIIEGKAELLARQLKAGEVVTTEKILADLTKITETSGRIAKIIKSMRILAHNSEKNVFEEAYLESFITNSLGICFEKFKTAGVALTIQIEANPKLHVNPTLMGQVLVNLAMNAFDAVMELPRSQHWIQVATRISPRNSQCVDIMVTDGGSGIPPEIREKIMNPFFTTKKVGKGTGLGLSLSKTIVMNHHGEITIDAQCPNTRFIVTLPITP